MPSLASLQRTARQLLGISAYTPTAPLLAAPSDDYVEDVRRALGGQLQPILPTQTRWYMADLEAAAIQADRGDMSKIGRLCRSMRRDGMISGLMGTRTSGLVALPKRFVGAEAVIQELTAETASRSLFDEMFPPSELALLAADGIGVGVGIAELVPVEGRAHPVMVRLEPEWLVYRPNESRWYYNSVAGPLPITPGDGRWILHTPGGTLNPWTYGSWHALGRAYILKDHAIMARANYGAKLANPARVAVAPPAASEEQRLGFLSKLMAWGLNSVFALPMGWDVKLLESNGRGWQVFRDETESANLEIMIELAGQVVTVTGGTGFANADIHQTIRADLIGQTGRSLAHTINTQGIPPYVFHVHGKDALNESPRVSWQTDPPEDLKASADAADSFGRGIKSANEVLREYGKEIDVDVLAARHGLPVRELTAKAGAVPTDLAKALTVDEVRAAGGYDEIGDERGDKTLQELQDAAKTETAEINADAKEDAAKAAPKPAAPKPRPTARAPSMRAGDFKEEDHPRQDDGKFGSGGGGGDKSDDKDDKNKADDAAEITSDGHTEKQIHEYVERAAADRDKQIEHVDAAKADFKEAGKLGKQADKQLERAESLTLSRDDLEVAAPLQEAGIFGRSSDEIDDVFDSDYDKPKMRTANQAIESAWRHIHAQESMSNDDIRNKVGAADIAERNKDTDVNELRDSLGLNPQDIKQVEQLVTEANTTRNEQITRINRTLAGIDKADAIGKEHTDDTLHSIVQDERDAGVVDRDRLIDAVRGVDRIKPVKDIEKAKKRAVKDAANY